MAAESSSPGRASPTGRRAGYVASLVVNVFLLVAVNLWPGWDVLPFLTSHTEKVLPWVNGSLIASVVANLIYLGRDPAWLRAVGDAVTTAVGLAAIVRVWQVFPFHLDRDAWRVTARVLLGIAAVGSVLGFVGAVARLIRATLRSAS